MHNAPAILPALDASIVSRLACPACHSDFLLEASHLICSGCRRAYPVVDGIPALIVEKAESAVDPNEK
jgi:hypothetical protein